MDTALEILKRSSDFETLPTGVLGAAVAEDIIITARAMDRLAAEFEASGLATAPAPNDSTPVDEAGAGQYFVRLFMQSTADKSKQYRMRFDDSVTTFDKSYQLGKLRVVVDRKSLFYFMGVIIDYVQSGGESGFVFLDTDDPKVSDYYLLLAEGQDRLDYVAGPQEPAEGYQSDSLDVQQGDVQQGESLAGANLLYQDELYDEVEPAEALADAAGVVESGAVLDVEPVLELEPEETKLVELAADRVEPDVVLDAESVPALEPEPKEVELVAGVVESEAVLDVEVAPVVEPEKLVQRRAVTGIHFQD